jgi:hypothetical protein
LPFVLGRHSLAGIVGCIRFIPSAHRGRGEDFSACSNVPFALAQAKLQEHFPPAGCAFPEELFPKNNLNILPKTSPEFNKTPSTRRHAIPCGYNWLADGGQPSLVAKKRQHRLLKKTP